MLRPILFVALVSFAAASNAAMVRFDVQFNVNSGASSPTNWLGSGAAPSTVSGVWEMDSAAFGAADFLVNNQPGISSDPVLASFLVSGIGTSSFHFAADGQTLWEGSGALGNMGGNATSQHFYDSTLSFSDGSRRLSFLDTSTAHILSGAEFQGLADPIAALFLDFTLNGPAFLTGEWGRLALDRQSVSIQRVPEPATLGLLGLAIVGWLAFDRRRRHAQGLIGAEGAV